VAELASARRNVGLLVPRAMPGRVSMHLDSGYRRRRSS
jgi:hypothetical protein